MTLKQRLIEDMQQAMRAKDAARLDSIRLLRAAIQRREVDEGIELDDDAVQAVVQKLIKQSRDATTQFEQGGRADLVEKEQHHIRALQAYLPAQLGEQEIDALIREAIADTGAGSVKDIGRVLGALKSRLAGRADMGAVSAKVKALLQAGG